MEHFALRRVAYEAMAIKPAPFMRYQRTSRFVEADGAAFIRQDMGGPGFNWAAFVGEKGTLADLLETGEKVFAGSLESWGVLVEVEAEHPVEAEMRARGWTVAEEEPAFVLPAITLDFVCPGGLAIRPALAEPDRKAFSETVAKVFGVLPDGWESLTPTAASANDPDLSYLVGWEDDQPVAAAMMYRVGPTAVIAGVATLPERRRRGYGTALTAAAAAEGARRGCTSAALRSGPMSLHLYQTMGFLPAGTHRTYAVPR